MPIKCSNCEFINPDIMRFCGGCGLRLVNPAIDSTDMSSLEKSEEKAQFGALIGSDLLDRFRAAGLQAAGQKRMVTVLFVDLSGFTNLSQEIDPEELYDIVQNCSKIFANAVYRYDGMVDKFTGDGLMALFGAPIAHENNAELALRASLDMHADLKRYSDTVFSKLNQSLTAHIGLNSGTVIVGGIGSNMMMNYTAIGDVVNRASRLMDKAQSGTTLVSERIYKQERGLFQFEKMPPLQLKGVTEPVQAYSLSGLLSNASSARVLEDLYSSMIGRSGEIDIMLQTLAQMSNDQNGRFITIIGEAGIGKSRLVSEFTIQASHLTAKFIKGHSYVYRKAITYWLLQNILLTFLDIEQADLESELGKRISQHLPSDLNVDIGDILPYFEYLFSIPHSDPNKAKFINFLPPEQLRSQLFRWVREILYAQCDQTPLVLMIEDFQWADNASIEFIQSITKTMSKKAIMVIIASRPSTDVGIEATYAGIRNTLKTRATTLQLTPLTSDQTGRLISQLSATENLPDELTSQMIERAGGIPLYAEEIIRGLRDSGALQQVDGHWEYNEAVNIGAFNNSDTIEGLILTRFDNLDPTSRHILKIASVLGKSFSVPLLSASMKNVPSGEILPVLESMIQKGFIDKDPTVSEDYIFKNLLISEVIYSTQLKKERKELHGLAGAAIEQVFANALTTQTDMLARHYFWSDNTSKGLHYQLLAAQNATKRFNIYQAKEYYENANELLAKADATTTQIFDALTGLGDVNVMIGNYPSARTAYEKALAQCTGRSYDDRVFGASMLRKIGHTFDKQGETDRCVEKLMAAKERLAGINAAGEMAQISSDMGWVDFRRGRLDEAEDSLLKAEQFADESQNAEVISTVLNRLGGLYFEKNDMQMAREYTLKSLEQWKIMGNLIGLAKSYNNLALLEWKQGSWKDALAHFGEGVEIQRKMGNTEGLVIINTNMGLIRMDMGDISEAVQLISKAQKMANTIGHRSYAALTTLYLGKAYSINLEWDRGLEYLLEAEKLLLDLDDPEYLMDVTLDLANALAHVGQIGKATERVNAAKGHLDELEPDLQENNQGRLHYVLGEIAFCKGDHLAATEHYELAISKQQQSDFLLEQAKSHFALARAYHEIGLTDKAKTSLLKARKIFTDLGANLDLQRSRELEATFTSHR